MLIKFSFNKNVSYKLDSNSFNVDGVNIECNDNSVKVEFTGKNGFTINSGNGYYIKNSFWVTGLKAKISGMMPDMYEESIFSSYYIYNDNSLELVMKNHNTPLLQSVIIEFNDEDCVIKVNNRVLTGKLC